jgi:hypothetical protein
MSQSPIYNVNNDIWFMDAKRTIFAPYAQNGASNNETLCDRTRHTRHRGHERRAIQGRGVLDNKTFCIYLAESEAAVKEHAKLSGFPATKITEVRTVLDPMTEVA